MSSVRVSSAHLRIATPFSDLPCHDQQAVTAGQRDRLACERLHAARVIRSGEKSCMTVHRLCTESSVTTSIAPRARSAKPGAPLGTMPGGGSSPMREPGGKTGSASDAEDEQDGGERAAAQKRTDHRRIIARGNRASHQQS